MSENSPFIPSPTTATSAAAMAGPATRAPLNMEELSAIAFSKFSRPTISIKNVCRTETS